MRHLLTFVSAIAVFVFLHSCQKELSLEYGAPATGTLQSSSGECLPKLVAGSYVGAKALNDSNFIEVTVNVVTPGPYTIYSDTTNGYSFKATGTFANTGTQKVKLKGTGTPLNAAINTFTIVFGTDICMVDVTVLPSGSPGGPASFTLDGAPGGCSTFNLQGTYYKDTTLDGRHSIAVNVMVASVGNYSISTTPVNGYFFSNSGTFGAPGPAVVVLQGVGKPVNVGTDNFTVTGGNSTCTFPVTVIAPPPPAGGNCTATLQGTYKAGTAATTTNKVVIAHSYATAGNYTVTTAPVNGFSFGPANITATAGSNSITLNATGTPLAAGTNTFTVNFGDGQTCTFSVVVDPATPVPVTSYFPLTANSWWSYDESVNQTVNPDSVKVTNVSSATINGNTYRRFQYRDDTNGAYDTLYYRRNADDYYQYANADYYVGFQFTNNVAGDILFLKEVLTTGATWNSALFSGTALDVNSNPVQVELRYAFTCADANATVTFNGKTFTNVYKITFKGQYRAAGSSTAFQDDVITWTAYYAKGVGMIDLFGVAGSNNYELKIRNWQVF